MRPTVLAGCLTAGALNRPGGRSCADGQAATLKKNPITPPLTETTFVSLKRRAFAPEKALTNQDPGSRSFTVPKNILFENLAIGFVSAMMP